MPYVPFEPRNGPAMAPLFSNPRGAPPPADADFDFEPELAAAPAPQRSAVPVQPRKRALKNKFMGRLSIKNYRIDPRKIAKSL